MTTEPHVEMEIRQQDVIRTAEMILAFGYANPNRQLIHNSLDISDRVRLAFEAADLFHKEAAKRLTRP